MGEYAQGHAVYTRVYNVDGYPAAFEGTVRTHLLHPRQVLVSFRRLVSRFHLRRILGYREIKLGY